MFQALTSQRWYQDTVPKGRKFLLKSAQKVWGEIYHKCYFLISILINKTIQKLIVQPVNDSLSDLLMPKISNESVLLQQKCARDMFHKNNDYRKLGRNSDQNYLISRAQPQGINIIKKKKTIASKTVT